MPTPNLQPFTVGGASYDSIYHGLYLIRQLRYLSPKEFKELDKVYPQFKFYKTFTAPKMRELAKLKYLIEHDNGTYSVPDEVISLLRKRKFLVKYLPAKPEGTGGINAMNNVREFIKCMALPNYMTLLFPTYTYIDPDALLVRNYPDGYKLTFLEIQEDDTQKKLEEKAETYRKLARDIKVFEDWKEKASVLELRVPTLQEFKFNVTFICSHSYPLGEGFNFSL